MKLSVFLVATMLLGCARPPEPSGSPSSTSGAVAASQADCPMMAPGATSTAVDTDQGVAITFTAAPEAVASLRAHVHRMAERQGTMMAGCSCRMMMGDAGRPMAGMTMMQGMRMPPADVRVDDVDGGVRLTLTARDPADAPALRAHAHMHVDHMKAGGCSMR